MANIKSIRRSADAFLYLEYSRQESNLRLLPPEGSALSTELREQKSGNVKKFKREKVGSISN